MTSQKKLFRKIIFLHFRMWKKTSSKLESRKLTFSENWVLTIGEKWKLRKKERKCHLSQSKIPFLDFFNKTFFDYFDSGWPVKAVLPHPFSSLVFSTLNTTNSIWKRNSMLHTYVDNACDNEATNYDYEHVRLGISISIPNVHRGRRNSRLPRSRGQFHQCSNWSFCANRFTPVLLAHSVKHNV